MSKILDKEVSPDVTSCQECLMLGGGTETEIPSQTLVGVKQEEIDAFDFEEDMTLGQEESQDPVPKNKVNLDVESTYTSQWAGTECSLREARNRRCKELVRSQTQSAEQNYNLVEQIMDDGSELTTFKRYSYRAVHLLN